MLTRVWKAALSAALAILLLAGLCACGGKEEELPPEETPVPPPRLETGGTWAGWFDAGDELMRALGVDLTPWLSGPLLGELRLTVDRGGSAFLSVDYDACAPALRAALEACLRELQAEESGEDLKGLALAEALGGDPAEMAAAICDELTPPYEVRSGRLNDAKTEIVWAGGSVSALREEAAGLRLSLAGLGEIALSPLS